MIRVTCPKCGEKLLLEGVAGGGLEICAACGGKFRVSRPKAPVSASPRKTEAPAAGGMLDRVFFPKAPPVWCRKLGRVLFPHSHEVVRAIPLLVRLTLLLIILPLVGLGPYWWWTYSGLYRWLAEAQIRFLEVYLPFYTGVLVIGLTWGLAAVAAALGLRLLVALDVFPVDPERCIETSTAPTGDQERGSTVNWGESHKGRIGGLTVGIMALGWAVVLFLGARHSAELVHVTAADLEQGISPPSRWLVVHGKLLWEQAISESELQGTHKLEHYVPLVSEQWRPGNLVAVFVEVYDGRREQAVTAAGQFKGLLALGGLPGPVRKRFEDAGLRPEEHYEMLQFQHDPAQERGLAWFVLVVGAGILTVTALVWVVKARTGEGKPMAPAPRPRGEPARTSAPGRQPPSSRDPEAEDEYRDPPRRPRPGQGERHGGRTDQGSEQDDDEEDPPRRRSGKRRRKRQAWPTGWIIGLAVGGGALATTVLVLAVVLAQGRGGRAEGNGQRNRNFPVNAQPGNPNVRANVPDPVAPPPLGGRPIAGPLRAVQMTYTVTGGRSPIDQLPQLRQALVAVPGVDPESIEVAADSISFQVVPAQNYAGPCNDALKRLGYRVLRTSSRPVY